MCPDTKALLAYVKSELFFAAICYYIKINPKPITAMANYSYGKKNSRTVDRYSGKIRS